MPRAALSLLAVALVAAALVVPAAGQGARGVSPHLDRASVPGGCDACHRGHGVSGSPMLPGSAKDLCLACHDSQARASQMAAQGLLAASARPPLLGVTLAQPFTHPLTAEATSRDQAGAVTCTSCHSPHRGARQSGVSGAPGNRRLSPRDPRRFEYELCESCHGSAGTGTQSPLDLSRLFAPQSRSYHPVEAPAQESSPSVDLRLTGHQINCTDCHGNSDATGPRGPHGSSVQHLLAANYLTVDGSDERPTDYQLCYQCHDRTKVLDSPRFPLHRLHVVVQKASCATCHNPHGSIANRALIRFGEETTLGTVAPSVRSGRLAFVSDAAGSGQCYLTCHGRDHAPEGYGSDRAQAAAARARQAAPLLPGAGAPRDAGSPKRPPAEHPRSDPRESPPPP